MTLQVPDRLIKAIIFARGKDEGEAWLAALPRRVDIYLRRWRLEPLQVADGGAMSCCLFCVLPDDTEAVLKIPFDIASGRLESRSLRRWALAGASPAVLASAAWSGVFLMRRVLPGSAAVLTGAPSESEHFRKLIHRMTRPHLGPMPGLKTVESVTRMRLDWARERFLDPGYEPQTVQLPDVERLLGVLMASGARESHVLHGDLQAKNILVGSNGTWQAIDPFTCQGDLNAEAALWIVVQHEGAIEDRINELAEDPQLTETRLRAWTFIYAIAEYRAYLPANAARIRAFTTGFDWQTLARAVGAN